MTRIGIGASLAALSIGATLAIAAPASADGWQDTGFSYPNVISCQNAGDVGVDQGYWVGYQCRGTRPNMHLWVNYG